MKTNMLAVVTLVGALVAMPVLALDLQQARSSGAVGERSDGYAEALQGSADAKALVAEVNAKRREEYTRIAQEKGQPVGEVGKVFATQIINSLPAGAQYQAPDGTWKKR
jgi:uncharacterized protein YdbL (DUF1318 family)